MKLTEAATASDRVVFDMLAFFHDLLFDKSTFICTMFVLSFLFAARYAIHGDP